VADILHVATRKGLFAFRRNRGKWVQDGTPAFLGEPVSAVLSEPGGKTVHAALALGHFGVKLHRTANGGRKWREMAPPAFPKRTATKKEKPSVGVIWTLAAGAPGILFAGTTPGGLFRSTNNGETWSLVESLWNVPQRKKWFGGGFESPGIHTVLADPRDPKKLTIGISCGGVWKSPDGGKSWSQAGQGLRQEYMPPELAFDPATQDVHRLAMPATDPDTVWCQHHNGMFLSKDGGATFKEFKRVKPSVFGFAVAAHPKDPSTAWFVPAVKDECRVPVDGKLTVTRTTDGGTTFKSFSKGLPRRDSYDLIYRHGLDVDETGRRLAFGTTTGNLWTSADGGESWSHVSGHLPPIAQVAFA
jgi:photosystem II stability/assembly factor-like uncharacterized protein